MLEVVAIRPTALTDLEAARDYLSNIDGLNDNMIAQLVNGATGVMERYTARKLKARPYINALSVSCTTVANSPTLTSAAAFGGLRAGLLISGAGITAGTFVKSIADTSTLTMSLPASAASTAARTFTGHGPVLLDGNDADEIILPELPLKELITAKARSDSGGLSSLNTASYRGIGQGQLVLPNDTFPEGRLNIELECVIGYADTDDELNALEATCRRLVQVMYTDFKDKIGRGNQLTVQGIAVSYIDRDLPADIKGVLDRFARMW